MEDAIWVSKVVLDRRVSFKFPSPKVKHSIISRNGFCIAECFSAIFFFYGWYFSYDFQGPSVAHPMNSLVIMRGAFLPVSVVMAWTTVMMEATRGAVVSSVFHFSPFFDAQSIDTFFSLMMLIFSSVVLSTWLFCSNLSFSNSNSFHHVNSAVPVSCSHSSANQW